MVENKLIIAHKITLSDAMKVNKFVVCVTVHHLYNNINSQLYAIIIIIVIIILLIISISSTCFGRKFRPSSGALDCW